MSLRYFHCIFLLTVCAVMAALGLLIGNSQIVIENGEIYRNIAFALAGLLFLYSGWFLWKTRGIH